MTKLDKLINKQIKEELMIDYNKINKIAKLANKYSLILSDNNMENFNITMNFYFKIFKYLSPNVIKRLKENYNWTLLYAKTNISEDARDLINYSIIIHESNTVQFLKSIEPPYMKLLKKWNQILYNLKIEY